MAQIPPPSKTYDVCIVGSGAGGGMAAYALTKAGANVILLEAGGVWYGSKDSKMMLPNYASRSEERRVGKECRL